MAALPLTVTQCDKIGGGLFRVTVALHDGRLVRFVIPETLATIEAVSISSLALAQLLEKNPVQARPKGGKGRPHRAWTAG